MWNFTHTSIVNNLSLTCEFLPLYELQDLYVGYKQVLLVPWKPCTSLLSSTIDNTLSLNIFQNRLYRFFGLSCAIYHLRSICEKAPGIRTLIRTYLNPTPTMKGILIFDCLSPLLHITPFVKGFQVHVSCPHSNYKGNLDNLATFWENNLERLFEYLIQHIKTYLTKKIEA